MVNFYASLDKYIKQYEQHKPYKEVSIDYICTRIDWCWKWRKITRFEMEELTDRICKIMKEF